MKRENILITEHHTTKRLVATKFTAPGNIPAFDSSIHFGEEENDVTMQNCIIKANALVKSSPEDTYDFETGALIALMKMCGSDKVVRACNEVFSYEKDLHELRKDNNNLREANKGLQEEVKRLKGESESHWKKYQRNIQKKQDRINELNNIEEEYIKLREEYDSLFEENEKLQHEYDLCKNSENALKCSVDYLNKSIAKLNTAIYGYKEDLYNVSKRCREFEEENEKLKLDCEKLQHGYIDTDMIFCGGRQNGKQYTLLVDLFKKLDQKKVDAAYKEAYDKWIAQPVWQKEVFKQIQKDQLASLLEAGKYLYKIPTKREEMWNDILTCGDCEHSKYVKVKREDLETFAKECNEKKIFSVTGYEPNPQFYWSDDDSYTFQIFRKPAGFICAKSVCNVFKDTIVDYLPPMRWDLFKKGRLVVKVDVDNYEDFYNKCEEEIGRKPLNACKGTFTVYYSKGTFHRRPYNDDVPYAKKVVNWEDVR